LGSEHSQSPFSADMPCYRERNPRRSRPVSGELYFHIELAGLPEEPGNNVHAMSANCSVISSD
jgi:hypothetical protein